MDLLEVKIKPITVNKETVLSDIEFKKLKTKHISNKKIDKFYPKFPSKNNESSLRGFFKRLTNYLKHQNNE
jgi:hypothetical protein